MRKLYNIVINLISLLFRYCKKYIIPICKKIIKFFAKIIRFAFAKLWTKVCVLFKKVQSVERIRQKVVWLTEKLSAFKIFFYTVVVAIPGFYSEFVRVYSVMFWVRVTLIAGFYPIKIFFTAIIYPFFVTYWINGAAFYVIFSMVCTLIYLTILWPRFMRNFFRNGDVYIFFLVQIFYFETCYSMPVVYIYFEPFYFDGLMFFARVYETYLQASKHNLPFDGSFIHHWNEFYVDQEEMTMMEALPTNSPLKPVSNRLAPTELYKVAVDNSTILYGFENCDFVEYFFKRHLPISWKNRAAYSAEMQGFYEFMEQMSPADRCMIWNSDMSSFDRFFDFLVRDDSISLKYEEEQGYRDEWSDYDDIPDLFTWYWYTYRFIKRPDAPRLPCPNARMLHDILSSEVKDVPPYILELLKVPEIGEVQGTFESRRFERLVRAGLHVHANRVNSRIGYQIRSFFDTPGWVSTPEHQTGFYIELRAQRKADGVHIAPALLTRRFNRPYHVYPGTTLYHQLYMTHSDYQTRKDLQFLEKWTAFFSPRYPFNSAPLLHLDKIFANNNFLGLVINFIDTERGDLNYFGHREPWQLESSAYYNRETPPPSFYSSLQQDFSPTYNLDVLEFIKRLPGRETEQNLYVQFSPGSDLNPVDLGYYRPGFGNSEFKILVLYGQRGLVFSNFLRYSFYKTLVDQQWNLFLRDKMYDPLTGKLCWTLGTQVWTWGVSQRFINDSRMINIYNSNFGVTSPRKVPYPTRFYMPLMRQIDTTTKYPITTAPVPKYSIPVQKFETYYVPYQFDRWSGPHPVDEYQTTQGGYYLRTLQDPRTAKGVRFNRLVSYSRLDPVFTDNFLFNTRGLLNNPIISSGNRYAPHRGYDRFTWPTYMNNEMRKYKPEVIRPKDLDFDKQPWDMDLQFVRPGFNKRVPRYMITITSRGEPGSRLALFIAYYLSVYYDFTDFLSPMIKNYKKSWYTYYCSFNRRWAGYYYRSFITYRRNGYKYHNFDMWWNKKIDYLVCSQRADIIGRGLWGYRGSDLRYKYRGRQGILKGFEQERYFNWIADMISIYHAITEDRAPYVIHRDFGDASKLTYSETLNSPIANYPAKVPSWEPYRDLQPKVIRALDDILWGVQCILYDEKWSYHKAGKRIQGFMDECREKYPDAWLYKEFLYLLEEEEKNRIPRASDNWNFLDWPGRRGRMPVKVKKSVHNRLLDNTRWVESYTVEKEALTVEKIVKYTDLINRRREVWANRVIEQSEWDRLEKVKTDTGIELPEAYVRRLNRAKSQLRWRRRRILPE